MQASEYHVFEQKHFAFWILTAFQLLFVRGFEIHSLLKFSLLANIGMLVRTFSQIWPEAFNGISYIFVTRLILGKLLV